MEAQREQRGLTVPSVTIQSDPTSPRGAADLKKTKAAEIAAITATTDKAKTKMTR